MPTTRAMESSDGPKRIRGSKLPTSMTNCSAPCASVTTRSSSAARSRQTDCARADAPPSESETRWSECLVKPVASRSNGPTFADANAARTSSSRLGSTDAPSTRFSYPPSGSASGNVSLRSSTTTKLTPSCVRSMSAASLNVNAATACASAPASTLAEYVAASVACRGVTGRDRAVLLVLVRVDETELERAAPNGGADFSCSGVCCGVRVMTVPATGRVVCCSVTWPTLAMS